MRRVDVARHAERQTAAGVVALVDRVVFLPLLQPPFGVGQVVGTARRDRLPDGRASGSASPIRANCSGCASSDRARTPRAAMLGVYGLSQWPLRVRLAVRQRGAGPAGGGSPRRDRRRGRRRRRVRPAPRSGSRSALALRQRQHRRHGHRRHDRRPHQALIQTSTHGMSPLKKPPGRARFARADHICNARG